MVVTRWVGGTAAKRAANVTVPVVNSVGIETDTGRLVVANGTSTWATLGSTAKKTETITAVNPTIATTAATPVVGQLNGYNCTSGALTGTLPTAASVAAGTLMGFWKTDTTVNALSVALSGTDTIDSVASTLVMVGASEKMWFASDGVSQWFTVGGYKSTVGLDARYPLTGDSRMSNSRTPTAHASTHAPGGTDAVAFDLGVGLMSARPTAAATNLGLRYVATDVAGGTEYRSSGSAWIQTGGGVTGGASSAVTSVAGRTGAVVLAESDITSLVTDLAAKAALASPTFTGVPVVPTASAATSTTQAASTAFVTTAIAANGITAWNQTVNSAAVTPTMGVLNTFSCTSGPITVTLPKASTVLAGATIGFFKQDNSGTIVNTSSSTGYFLNITTVTGDSVEGTTTLAIALINEKVWLVSDGVSAWFTIAGYRSDAALDARYQNITAAPNGHNNTHVPNGSDALPFDAGADIYANIPVASAYNLGLRFLATNQNGGTEYRSNGTAWVQTAGGVTVANTVAGRSGTVVLVEADIANLVSDLAARALLASPTFTGVPAVPTAAAGTSTTQAASTAFVTTAASGVRSGAELAHSELTANTAAINTTANTSVGLAATFVSDGTPIYLRISGIMSSSFAASNQAYFKVWDGTIGSGTQMISGIVNGPASSWTQGIVFERRYTPTAGSHTFNMSLAVSSVSGTGFMLYGNSTMPFNLSIFKA